MCDNNVKGKLKPTTDTLFVCVNNDKEEAPTFKIMYTLYTLPHSQSLFGIT